MKEIIRSVRQAIGDKNFYAALFAALAVPDICSALEYGKTSGKKYASWWNKYLVEYRGFLTGNDCYALRCAALHEGSDNILGQDKRELLDYYVFLTQGPHLNLFDGNIIQGNKQSFLQLNVEEFCIDICDAAEQWINDHSGNKEISRRIGESIEIHEPGYVHLGLIKFG